MYEIRKFAITFSRKISQNTKRSQCELEKKLKELESNLNSEANFNEYTLNLFMREQLKVLELEANVDSMKKVKSKLIFFLILKKSIPLKHC